MEKKIDLHLNPARAVKLYKLKKKKNGSNACAVALISRSIVFKTDRPRLYLLSTVLAANIYIIFKKKKS